MRASYTREKGCWPLTPRCLRWCGATEAEKLKKICVRVYLGVPLCDIYPVGSCVVSSELVQVGQICGCSSQHEIILHFGYVSVQRHKRITYHDNYVSKNSKKKGRLCEQCSFYLNYRRIHCHILRFLTTKGIGGERKGVRVKNKDKKYSLRAIELLVQINHNKMYTYFQRSTHQSSLAPLFSPQPALIANNSSNIDFQLVSRSWFLTIEHWLDVLPKIVNSQNQITIPFRSHDSQVRSDQRNGPRFLYGRRLSIRSLLFQHTAETTQRLDN